MDRREEEGMDLLAVITFQEQMLSEFHQQNRTTNKWRRLALPIGSSCLLSIICLELSTKKETHASVSFL